MEIKMVILIDADILIAYIHRFTNILQNMMKSGIWQLKLF